MIDQDIVHRERVVAGDVQVSTGGKQPTARRGQWATGTAFSKVLIDTTPGPRDTCAGDQDKAQDRSEESKGVTEELELTSLDVILRAQQRYHRRLSHHGGVDNPLLPELDEALLKQLAKSIKCDVPDMLK